MHEDPSPFEGTSPVASLAQAEGSVTLVEGQTFCLSGRSGDMSTDYPHGLFLHDTRVLSRWDLRVGGHRLEPLAVDLDAPFSATFAARGHPEPGRADAVVVVFRHRDIGAGMLERIVVTNHGLDPIVVPVELQCDADFADLFAVKESRVVERRHLDGSTRTPAGARFTGGNGRRAMVVDVHATCAPGGSGTTLAWSAPVAPGASWEVVLEVQVTVDGELVAPRYGAHDVDALSPADELLASWRASLPVVETEDDALRDALHRTGEDLGALRIFDPEHPEVPVLAAGAPWFMTVFGRDSLLTAWMALLADPSLARGVLETLARFQGRRVDVTTEEEPGKILHEMRFGTTGLALSGADVYYGSVDATPLFVMLLGEARRWGLDDATLAALLPHADQALAWMETFGDRDGDGYLEYQRLSLRGLVNQGWKDSWDAIRHADGELAPTPIALCEVQGYAYAAYLARAGIAQDAGDRTTARRWSDKAAALQERFNEDFWLPDLGWFALGLDRDKRPIEALASNMGHCLWTGIVEPEHAAAVAQQLLSPELFSGWGVRTLSALLPSYNPVSYHNGSVWPHDNAICAAGLARYGFVEEAHRVIEAQLAVADTRHGRLPELFAGFDREILATPAIYPSSCSPQAWAAAAPLLWLRTILRLDPVVPRGHLHVDPVVPEWLGRRLRVQGIVVAGREVSVEVVDGQVRVSGHEGLRILPARPPTVAAGPSPEQEDAASSPAAT